MVGFEGISSKRQCEYGEISWRRGNYMLRCSTHGLVLSPRMAMAGNAELVCEACEQIERQMASAPPSDG